MDGSPTRRLSERQRVASASRGVVPGAGGRFRLGMRRSIRSTKGVPCYNDDAALQESSEDEASPEVEKTKKNKTIVAKRMFRSDNGRASTSKHESSEHDSASEEEGKRSSVKEAAQTSMSEKSQSVKKAAPRKKEVAKKDSRSEEDDGAPRRNGRTPVPRKRLADASDAVAVTSGKDKTPQRATTSMRREGEESSEDGGKEERKLVSNEEIAQPLMNESRSAKVAPGKNKAASEDSRSEEDDGALRRTGRASVPRKRLADATDAVTSVKDKTSPIVQKSMAATTSPTSTKAGASTYSSEEEGLHVGVGKEVALVFMGERIQSINKVALKTKKVKLAKEESKSEEDDGAPRRTGRVPVPRKRLADASDAVTVAVTGGNDESPPKVPE